MRKPCKECPFRRESLPGYLGRDNANNFLATTLRDTRMPCHLTVDYEAEDWREQVADAPECAGAATFFANTCKLSKRKDALHMKPDKALVFSRAQEFLEHHGGTVGGFETAMYSDLLKKG